MKKITKTLFAQSDQFLLSTQRKIGLSKHTAKTDQTGQNPRLFRDFPKINANCS